jgi:hypothetical protein
VRKIVLTSVEFAIVSFMIRIFGVFREKVGVFGKNWRFS